MGWTELLHDAKSPRIGIGDAKPDSPPPESHELHTQPTNSVDNGSSINANTLEKWGIGIGVGAVGVAALIYGRNFLPKISRLSELVKLAPRAETGLPDLALVDFKGEPVSPLRAETGIRAPGAERSTVAQPAAENRPNELVQPAATARIKPDSAEPSMPVLSARPQIRAGDTAPLPAAATPSELAKPAIIRSDRPKEPVEFLQFLPNSSEFEPFKEAALKALPDVYHGFRPFTMRVFVQRADGFYSQSGFIMPNGDIATATHGVGARRANRLFGTSPDSQTPVPLLIKRSILGTDMSVVHPERLEDRMRIIPNYSVRPPSEPLVLGEPLIAVGNGANSEAVVGHAGAFSSMRRINVPAPDGPETIVIESHMQLKRTGSGSALLDAQGRLVGSVLQSNEEATMAYAIPAHQFLY